MKGNLLIVDDEELLLEQLQFILSEHADKVFTALNGIQALEILAAEKIHCVVCDINMPKMNGVEVLKKIRELNNDVPFIFFTGHGNKELMMEAAKYGAYDFLNKPNFEGLDEVVKGGLKRGLRGPLPFEDSLGFLSEYKQMLDEMDKK